MYYCFLLQCKTYHKVRCLKQHTFIISQFLWVRGLSTVWMSAMLRVSQGCNKDVGAFWGKDLLSCFVGLLAWFISWQLYDSWQLISSKPAIRNEEVEEIKGEIDSSTVDINVLSNHRKLVRNKSQVPPILKGRGYTKVWISRGRGHGATLKSVA